jgi:hypothetical protein
LKDTAGSILPYCYTATVTSRLNTKRVSSFGLPVTAG